MTSITGREILNLSMPSNDAGATSIRGYLAALARGVWDEGECFSGKRPFGNSSWQYEIYEALISHGQIYAFRDSDGDLEDFDQAEADRLIGLALSELAQGE